MNTERPPPGDAGTAPCGGIRAEMRDLKQLVKLAVRRRKWRSAGTRTNPLLLLAPKVPILPTVVVEDRNLTHRDKLMWLNLRLRLDDTSRDRTLPSIRELAESTDLGNKDTVARSMAMLRCRRYLSVCATAWHGGGRKVGTAYVLHAPRLPMKDVLFLDPEYPGFVKNLREHSEVRLRGAASEEFKELAAFAPEAGSGVSSARQSQ